MKRGDIVTVSAPGDYGKPRPAVVVQSDGLDGADSVLVALITSTLRDAPIYRLTVAPTPENGLKVASQIMVEKIAALRRERCGEVIGRLDAEAIETLNAMLAVVIGLAD